MFRFEAMTGWPEGLYGLPMALNGCPANSTINWKTGTLYQGLEDTNQQTSHTYQFHLKAVVNGLGVVEQHFA